MFLVDWPGGSWEETLRMVLFVLGAYLAALYLTLIYWTYRDIRQRSRDAIVQIFSVLLVMAFFLPGHWIYLILRPRYTLTELYERSLEEEALLQELEDQKACPTCRRRVKDEYLVCPSCRTQLKEGCRSCGRPLSYAWFACPYCGLEKSPREALGARQARQVAQQQQVRSVAPAQQQRAATAAAAPARPTQMRETVIREAPAYQPRAVGDDGPVIDAAD
jgi:predicted RNA-binding Zn-ribbon protein involved in translation (DUF1610 family)